MMILIYIDLRKRGAMLSSHERRNQVGALNPNIDETIFRMLRAFAVQATTYVMCCYAVWIWIVLGFLSRASTRNKAHEDELIQQSSREVLELIASFFFPLQGFLNFVVYMRPIAVRIRELDPTLSFLRAMAIATFSFGRVPSDEQRQNNENLSRSSMADTVGGRSIWGSMISTNGFRDRFMWGSMIRNDDNSRHHIDTISEEVITEMSVSASNQSTVNTMASINSVETQSLDVEEYVEEETVSREAMIGTEAFKTGMSPS